MKSPLFCFTCVFLLFQSLCRGQDNTPLFDQYIQHALALWKTPGLSVVVVKDDKVVFRKAYGVVELGKAAPFSTGTLSVCASTTKAMTAVCMGMLVDEGKVKWTDKLSEVFPAFRVYDPYVSAELTVKDLFTHNAGLGNADLLWVYGYPREEILRRMRTLPPAYSLRSSFTYQNLMYIAAGELIQHLSGQTWEDFVTQRVFSPLGMQHTYASYQRSIKEPSHEVPHFMINDSIQPIQSITYDNVGPAGGVWSCADDMDKWMMFLLDSATTSGGKRLLSAGVYKELFKPQSIVTESEFYPTQQLTHPHWTTYGLGWFQEDYRGKMVQFHTGSLDGAVAILGLLPSERFGIYIFGNLDHTEVRHALMYKAMDLWGFHDNGRDWSGDFHALYKRIRDESKKREKEKEALRVPGTHPALPLASYAGKYSNETYGEALLTVKNDTLLMQLPNGIRMTLKHWDYDVFQGVPQYAWWDKSWVKFSLSEDGKIVQFDKDGALYTLVP
jgi:CubicO group peptidase (beta-lactamase class C family)